MTLSTRLGAVVLALAVFGAAGTVGGQAPERPPAPTTMAVSITITDTTLDAPQALPAGEFAFRVTNDGTVGHNLHIAGGEEPMGFARELAPGETRELLVNLAVGTYTLYCPIAGHSHSVIALEVVPAEADQGITQ